MSKKTKATSAGNEKPALRALNDRIDAFGGRVKGLREEGQALLLDTTFHAMAHGNVSPINRLIDKSEGMNRVAMVAWLEAFAHVERRKDKDGENKLLPSASFKQARDEFAKDKLAFAKTLRGKPKFWEFKPDRPFEGLDLVKLLISAANKVEKAGKEEGKREKVKGLDLLPKVREFIQTLSPSTENDDDGSEGSEDVGPITIDNTAEQQESVAVH